MAVPAIKLNSGFSIPALGFGTWLSKKGEVGAAVKVALEHGYRHIDCAEIYGNEDEIGETFNTVFSAGTVKREDVYITSKLWVKNFTRVKEACKNSLKNLQLEYLDLYLIHLPFELEKDLPTGIPTEKGVGLIGWSGDRIWTVWQCMQELVDEGLVRSIGISNFTIKKTDDLLKRSPKIRPACNQVELNPYLPQDRLCEYCKKEDITMVAYTPLGNPGFIEMTKGDATPVLKDANVTAIAEKHKVTNAQVLLAWAVTRGTGVLAKSVKEHRVIENFGCLNIKLDADDMKAINSITTRQRYLPQNWALKVDEETADLWDGEYLG